MSAGSEMAVEAASRGADPDFHWDDIVVGEKHRSSLYAVSESEIIAFATKYDPLPIHIDPEVAAASQFGSITAAGSHMLAIRQRLVHEFAFGGGIIASIGYDEVRFLAPLRAGQNCQVEVEFLDKTASSKRPDRGVAIIGMTLLADGAPVLKLKDIALMRRRVPAGGLKP
jgi:acyl dehydratase